MDSLSQPAKIGKYEILGLIGRGGMGTVYSGRDPVIDRIVAIKTIRVGNGETDGDNQRDRLRMEARSAGKLQHPNVVTIYDYGEEGELSYIVMEFVEGANLSRVIHSQMLLSLPTRLDLLMQIARGLAYAHEYGVVHRDLKPSNICVTTRGIAKILDFGLARFDDTKLTRTGYLSGTIAYMSPERFSGETGPQDDIFALGAVAYELLTYRRAFPGDTTPEVISRILGGPMPPSVAEIAGYPPELDAIVLRAMARDPAERYGSASELESALREFTRSDSYLQFVAAQAKLPEFQRPAAWSDENVQNGANPYSSSRNVAAVVSPDAPTLHASPRDTALTETHAPADPTLMATRVSPGAAGRETVAADYSTRAATPLAETRRRTVAPFAAGAAAALLIAATAALIALRRDDAAVPAPAQAAPATSGASVQHAAVAPPQESAVQLATRITEPAKQAADREPTPARAEEVASAQREQPRSEPATRVPARQTVQEPAPPSRQPQAQPQPQPQPQPPVVATPAAEAPPPVVQPAPQNPAPQPAEIDHEREIRSLFRQMAAAYQQKDVEFFRQRTARFSREMAAAIESSPSVAVDIAVTTIEMTGADSARVAVRRTDTFAETQVPPAVQHLLYELRREESGWRIVSLSRR